MASIKIDSDIRYFKLWVLGPNKKKKKKKLKELIDWLKSQDQSCKKKKKERFWDWLEFNKVRATVLSKEQLSVVKPCFK